MAYSNPAFDISSFGVLAPQQQAAIPDYLSVPAEGMTAGSGIFSGQVFNPSKVGGGGLLSGASGLDKINLGMSGLNTLAGLFLGLKQLSLSNKQFNFQRDFANTNLTNQIQSYNTTLADKARARSVMETGVDNSQAYVDKNKLAARTL